MDDMIDYVRDDVMPALMGMSGCVGMSMLCDRESGRAIVTSAWADETSMHATEQTVQDYRRRAAEMMSGEQMAQAWEIAVMHRMHESHDGACARVAWGESDPARAQDNLDTFRMAMMPRMEELPGFCSVSLMVDRATGRSAMTTTYDSRADMERAADAGRGLREEFAPAMGVTITEMAEFDVVLHHLRVPETV
jgi:quinol monooxygenase YgiN